MPPKQKKSIPDVSIPLAQTPAPRKNKTQFRNKVLKGLNAIYAETDQTSPTAFTPPESRSKVKVLLGFLIFFAFLAAISWAGFFLFGNGQKFSEEKIEIKINGPEQAQSGQNIAYRVYFNNRQKTPLANVSLELRFPDNFKFVSADPVPTDKENRRWDLGALTENKGVLIEINGQFFGAADSDITLRAFLSYRPANFNADFQKIASFSSHLTPLPLEFSLTGPDELVAGEEALYQINLLNNGSAPLNNLELSLMTPTSLKISSLTPLPTKDQNFWKLSELPAGASSTFKIKASFTATAVSGSQTLAATLSQREAANSFLQGRAEKTTTVSQSNLTLAMLANGSAEKQVVNFEDKIPFVLSFENTGQTKLKNVTLRAVIDAPFDGEKSILNWPALEDKKDGLVKGEQRSSAIRRGAISWNKAQIPALAEIKPNDKGQVEFILPIRAKNEMNLAKLSEYKITAYLEALIGGAKAEEPAQIQSQTVTLVLNTDLSLSIQATMKEKKNLPIQIGQKYDTETAYSLAWTLANSWHEITDVKLTATLPENVEWKNITAVSAGEISFDPTTKQVVWQINRVPPSYPKTTISFEVGIKSAADDQGKEGMLMDKTRLEAADKITDENILLWKEAAMTIL